jgi:hypothetical protein
LTNRTSVSATNRMSSHDSHDDDRKQLPPTANALATRNVRLPTDPLYMSSVCSE